MFALSGNMRIQIPVICIKANRAIWKDENLKLFQVIQENRGGKKLENIFQRMLLADGVWYAKMAEGWNMILLMQSNRN